MDTLKPIFEQAQQGDLNAYGQIVTRFQDLAVGYGYAILKDFDLAQDAAQEAFTEAWINLSRIYDIYAFPALLRKIVFKHCDRLTRRGRHIEIVSMEHLVELTSREKQPDQIAQENEMQTFVQEAIETLPENEQQVVSLFYISDYSQQEVATFLDVPTSTVKNRLRSARKRLQERLFDMLKDNINENRPSKDDQFVQRVHEVLSPIKKEHGEDIYALFSLIGRPGMERQARNGRIAHSHYDWQTSRIARIDETLAAHLSVYDLQLRIGSSHIRSASINLMNTHPDYEDQGLMEHLIESSLDAMYTQGYDISCTRGGRVELFNQFGYVIAWPAQENYTVETDHLPTEDPDVELEEVHVNTIHIRDDVAIMHNKDHEGLTGTAIRPTYIRGKCPPDDDDFHTAYLFKDKSGHVVGYLYDGIHKTEYKDKEGRDFSHTDSAGDPEQILRVLGKIARDYKRPRVEFVRLPYHSALGRRVRLLPYEFKTINVLRGHANHIRIINLASTLTKVAPEFSRRLQKSHLKDYSGDLQINIPDQSTVLSIKSGEVTISPNKKADNTVDSGHAFAQLIIGKAPADEIVEMSGITCTGDAADLLDALFPAQHPQMPNEDL